MKKRNLLLGLIMVLSLASCGRKQEPQEEPQEEPQIQIGELPQGGTEIELSDVDKCKVLVGHGKSIAQAMIDSVKNALEVSLTNKSTEVKVSFLNQDFDDEAKTICTYRSGENVEVKVGEGALRLGVKGIDNLAEGSVYVSGSFADVNLKVNEFNHGYNGKFVETIPEANKYNNFSAEDFEKYFNREDYDASYELFADEHADTVSFGAYVDNGSLYVDGSNTYLKGLVERIFEIEDVILDNELFTEDWTSGKEALDAINWKLKAALPTEEVSTISETVAGFVGGLDDIKTSVGTMLDTFDPEPFLDIFALVAKYTTLKVYEDGRIGLSLEVSKETIPAILSDGFDAVAPFIFGGEEAPSEEELAEIKEGVLGDLEEELDELFTKLSVKFSIITDTSFRIKSIGLDADVELVDYSEDIETNFEDEFLELCTYEQRISVKTSLSLDFNYGSNPGLLTSFADFAESESLMNLLFGSDED